MDSVAGYHALAGELVGRYEGVSASAVHQRFLPFLTSGPDCIALDVGAGSGRDAAWLRGLGYEVVAVEPADGMRRAAEALHAGAGIRWLDDRLPSLERTHKLGIAFDVILLSGVFMHVPPHERARAFRKLVTLLKPGGHLLISVRDGNGPADRPMHLIAAGEIEGLAREHGVAIAMIANGEDQMGRADVHWTSYALRLADEGSGALPLLRGIILNDDKTATNKLGLLRAIARLADAHPALAVDRRDEDAVDVPLGAIALNWLRMYLPLAALDLPQLPGNRGPDKLGFAKQAFRMLLADQVSGQDLRIGARFTGDRAKAVMQALADARTNIARMPVTFTRYPNSATPVFEASSARIPAVRGTVTMDAETLRAFGTLRIPGPIWRTLLRLGAWIEPVLVSEWARLIRGFGERMERLVMPGEAEAALSWLDPARDTGLAREAAARLLRQHRTVHCVWSGKALRAEQLDIDHCFPWSAWPCGDLWNLMPAVGTTNRHAKRDRIPSRLALAQAGELIHDWWRDAWMSDEALADRFWREAEAALPIAPGRDLGEVMAGLEWRRLRLRRDQQVQEWSGARDLNAGGTLAP